MSIQKWVTTQRQMIAKMSSTSCDCAAPVYSPD